MSIVASLCGRSCSTALRRRNRHKPQPPLPCCAAAAAVAPVPFEPLENRWLFAAFTWDGGGDGTSWSDPDNWNRAGDNANVLPSSADSVTIDVATDPTIAIRTSVSVQALVSNEAIVVAAGGTLAVATTADVNAPLTLDGGTVQGGTYDVTGANITATGHGSNQLSGVTVTGDVVAPANARLRVAGGLTMTGDSALRLTGTNSYVGFVGSQTFPSGRIRFESASGTSNVTVEGASTLTIGAAATVSGGRGDLATTQFIAGGTYSVVNHGTIVADLGGTDLEVGSTVAFTNNGTLRAAGGGRLNVRNLTGNVNDAAVEGTASALTFTGGNYVNNNALSVPAGATLSLNGSWRNDGSLAVNGGTLNLGGSFTTAGLGAFTRSGGTVNLTGTLNNAGNTLLLDAASGSWNIEGGTLAGGTLQQAGGFGLLVGGNSNSNLSGLNVASGDIVAPGNARLRITNGLTMAPASALRLTGTNSYVGFVGTQTMASGQIRFEAPTGTSNVTVEGNSTLTLAPGVTVSGGRGDFATTQFLVGGTYSVVNQGSIVANVAGTDLEFGPTGTFTNAGTLRAEGGGRLSVRKLTGNTNAASVEGAASQLTLAGNYAVNNSLSATAGTTLTLNGTWRNDGTLAVSDGTLNLGGSFTTAGLGSFTRSGGTVNLTGTINNAGSTLVLDGGTGSWRLEGGTLAGGTLEQVGGNGLVIGGNTNSNLSGVHVASGDIIAPANARLRITNGLTMTSTSALRLTGSNAYVGFLGTQTMVSGQIRFESPSGNSNVTVEGHSTLTLGPGVTVSGGRGDFATTQFIAGGTYSLVNQGTIRADVAGTDLEFGPTGTFTNTGTLRATGGGRLSVRGLTGNLNAASVDGSGSRLTVAGTNYVNNTALSAPAGATLSLNGSWRNDGSIAVDGGTLDLGGSFTTAGLGSLTRTGGTINLTGTLNNSGSTLTLDANYGSWNLAGGTLSGGTLEQAADFGLVVGGNTNSTLAGVTIGSGDVVAPANARLRVTGGLAMAPASALRLTGSNSYVGFLGTQTMSSGQIRFEAPSGSSHVTVEGAATLTLAPGVTVRGGRGDLASTQFLVGGTYSLNNQGTIVADVPGTTLSVGSTGTFTNTGTLRAAGGSLSLPAFTNNGGSVEVGASSLVSLTGNYTQSSGTTLLQGGVLDPTGGVNIQGGTLTGSGTIRASVANSGQFIVGGAGAAGNLRVEGTFTQTATGAIDAEIGGATAGSQHDRLEVTGAATLGGTLNVALINAYEAPSTGIVYGVLTHASRTGSFATINGLSQANDRSFTVDYGTTRFALVSNVSDAAGPVVVSAQPAGLVNSSVASVRLQFNEPVAPASFTRDDVVLRTPSGVLDASLVSVVQVDATTFDVNFPSQSADGDYTVRVGPNVTDLAGNPMSLVLVDRNDFSANPSPAWTLLGNASWNQAAGVVRLTPATGNQSGAAYFGTPQQPNPFKVTFDFNLTAGGGLGGGADGLTFVCAENPVLGGAGAGIGYSGALGRSFAVEFDTFYNGGADPDNSHIGINWNGAFQPVTRSVSPWMLGSGRHTATVRFDGISLLTVTLQGPNGQVTTLSHNLPAEAIPSQYTFGFTSATGAGWANHDIDNVELYLLPNNGEGGHFTGSFTIDQAGPRILSATPAGDVNPPLSSFDVAFDTPINPSTFTPSDVKLTRPDGTSTAASTITQLNATTYRVGFAPQSAEGTYALEIGPDVRDPAGNLMDQDADGVRGEPAEDKFGSTVTVRAVDLQVTGLVVNASPAMQSGATVTVGWNDANTGNGATGGSWSDRVTVVNTTTNQTLVNTTVFYDSAALGPIAAGASRTRQYSFKLPDGNAGVGELRVTVTADASAQVPEANAAGTGETNNAATTTTTSLLAPYPDLRVTGLSVTPSGLQAGQVMTVRWDDTNDGDGRTPSSWSDRVVVRNLTTGQTLLNTTLFYDRNASGNGDILPGESRPREYQFRLPNGDSAVGQLQVEVTADTHNGIFEFNGSGTAESNNTATATVDSAATPYPDVVAEAPSFTPASPQSGQSVTVGWAERNTGTAAVTVGSYTRVRVTRASDGSVVVDQAVNFSAAANAALVPGGTVARQFQFALPGGPAGAGTFNVQITADNYNHVFEHNAAGTAESNNVTTGSFTSTLNSYPDLTVANLALTPAAPSAGQPVTIEYALANGGDGAVSQSFHYSVQVTHVPTGQSLYSRVEQYSVGTSGPIAAGGSVPRSATFTLPDGALGAGELRVTVRADVYNAVFEHNAAGTAEANNVAQATATSAAGQYPDLRVSGVSVASGTVAPGDQVLVSWTLTNGGAKPVTGPFSERVYLSADEAPGGDELMKTLAFDGTIEPGQSVTRNAVITVPAFGSGQRWLVVQTDSSSQVYEDDETNNTATGATALNIPLGLAITATHTQLSEGGGSSNVTISRNGPTSSPLVVSLANTQPGSLSVPASVTIPAGSSSVTFAAAPVNNTNVDGTRSAVVSATAAGYSAASLEVNVADDDVPTLSVQLSPNPVSEGEGADALRVRVFRNNSTSGPLTVHLSSDDALRLTVPATAVIPAGAAFVDVFGDVIDNVYVDGLRSIGVTASASGYTPGTDRAAFLDNDVPNLSLSAEQTTLSESAGTYGTTATVSRAAASPIDLYVQLTGGNGNLILPTFVKIPAFQTSASFSIGTLNNTDATADRTVVIVARAVDSFTRTPMESGKADLSVRITEDDGPTLSVTSQTPAIREDGTGTVRVRRNTGTSGDLTVSLLSSDTTELTVPATAVIPDGAAFVDVPVSGVSDGGIDGAANVTVSASAIGYGGGSAVVTVTDGDLPDLAVTAITAPTAGETGQAVTVSYTVTNHGVAEAAGSWTDRVFVSDRPVIDDRATQVRQFIRSTPVGAGGSYSHSFEVALPLGVGTAYVLVQTDYVGGISELREGNNTAASQPINVAASYAATVHVSPAGASLSAGKVFGSGQPVHLTGVATRPGGAPAAFEFVKVHVLVNGSKRTLSALTGGDGTFQTTFQPLTTEAGNYQVAAAHPGVDNFTPQDSFAIAGMRVGSDSVQLTPDFVVTRTGTVFNRSSVPITGIEATVLNVPEGLQVTVNAPSTLPGDGSANLLYSLLASKPDLGRGTVTIRLTSDQGATIDVPVTVDVVPLTASLVTTPGALDDGMVRGERKTVSFTLRNSGSAASGAVSVALPSFPWMRLVSPATIPSLEPGATATVSLELNPAADLPLQLYTGQIAINAANGASRALGFSFRALSVAQGDVQISVVDEYTYYVEGNPKVAGAAVRLYDPFTGALVAGGATDAAGNIMLPAVAEGAYQLEVFAPNHGTFRSRFDVKPGVVNTKEVFIQRQLVTYSWTVVPVDIQDTYKITLQPTFETNVPVPVVTVEEALVMPLVVEGEWTQFNVTLTNHGLIAAKGVKIQLPQSDYYEFRTLVDDVGDIPAKTTIQVPVGIRGRVGVTAAELEIAAREQSIRSSGMLGASQAVNLNCLEVGPDVPCLPKLEIKAVYYFECGPDNRFNAVPVSVEPVCVAKSIYEGLEQAWGTAAESLPSLGGNLANAPCALIDLILQCADTGLSDCKKAMIKAACRGITGFFTGGAAGAAGGVASSAKDLLECLCDLFNFSIDVGDVDLQGGGFGNGGGYGGGYLNPYGGGSGGSFSTSGCSPASGSSSTGSPVLLAPNADGSGVCATVTLRIEQQAVLTRTGFAGTFTLENGTAATTLSGIRVDIDIRDTAGNSANSKFGFRDPDVFGLGNVSGTGVLAAGQEGMARYLFVPTRDAAPTTATTYHIGGTLRYVENGVEVSVPLLPATITVHPDALLSLDYFLQRDVFSDDPFTDPVEPSNPFSLGVIVNNTGAGRARNFHIVSGQPEIIENEKGLLIDFEIIGTQVGGSVVSPSLTATFGDILAGTSKSARWLMTSTLQGHFIDYEASFEHVDDFGNPRTSLIDGVTFHELEHALRINLPGKGLADDNQFDFLANDVPDPAKLPDMIYFSSGGKAAVKSYTDATADGPATASDLSVQVSAPSVSSAGWSYLVFNDPGAGFVLKDVVRSDGSHLKVGDHAWRTDRVFGAEGVATYVNRVHLLDYESTGSYTLVYARTDETAPSVTQLGPVTPTSRSTPVDSVSVTFSEKLAAGSFDVSDIVLTRNGSAVDLAGVAGVTMVDDTHYTITGLSSVTGAAGNYVLAVNGAGVADASGNAGTGTATQSWATVAEAPVVDAIGDGISPLTNAPVGQVLVSFSKAIDAASFGLDDITLTRNNTAVALAGPATITQLSPTDFSIDDLGGFTAGEGTYVLAVNAAGITDTTGNAGVGDADVSWATDTTAPQITFLETLATNPRNIAVLDLDVEFSEPIDPATLTAADVSLVRDGGADLFTGGLTFTQLSPTKLRLSGFTSLTGVQGTYVFTVHGGGIADAAGNAVGNSVSTSWVLDTAAPGAPTGLAITPDNGSSPTDGRTNVSTLTLTGTVPEAGSTVRVVDLTTNTNFGAGVTTGGTFSKQLSFAAPGAHRLRVYAVDGAGNVSGDSFFDVFIDLAKPTVQSVTGLGSAVVSVPVSELTVTFNKAVAQSTFTLDDLTLSRDGAAVSLAGAAVVRDSATVYRVTGLSAATGALGEYVFTVNAPGVSDDAGNAGAAPYSVTWQHASAKASIGDTVFVDANFNGRLDTGEAGAGGVTVRLFTEAGDLVATTTTDSAGTYAFGDLDADGRYSVEFVAPAGYGFTHAHVSNDESDSDADVATGRTEVFDVAVGANARWDAGLVQLGSISGAAYNDANDNHQRDAAEEALGGFTVFVDLDRDNQRDEHEPSAQTGADGSYRFDNLRPGTYVVAMEVPPGWQQTSPDQAGVVVSLQSANLTPAINLSAVASPETPADGFSSAGKLIGLDRLAADSRFSHLTGAGYTVVVIDTGIDLNNSFFGPDANDDGIADRIAFQHDFGANDATAQDLTGHGTHIASIIGSGDATYRGVAPGVNFVVFKIFDDGGNAIFGQAEKALQWVTNNASLYNILAVNMSFGDGRNWDWPDATDCGCGNTVKRETYGLGDELATLRSMDVITSAAAGNNFYEVSGVQGMNYPAADPATISVGAVWDSDRGGTWAFNGTGAVDFATAPDAIAAFSQRQAGYLDIFAPGAVITGAKLGGGVTTMQGTSQSTAFVTGAAVLAQQLAIEHLGRRLTLTEFRTLIQSTGATVFDGDDENDNVINTGQAYSRLDVYKLAEAILAMSPGTPAPDGGGDDGHDEEAHNNGQGYAYQIALAPGGSYGEADFGLRTAKAPELELGSDPLQDKVVQGYSFQRGVSFSDADAVDDWTVTVDYGDGSVVTTTTAFKTFSFDHVYANKGLYNITVTITDDRGLSTTDTMAFKVIPAVNDVEIAGYDGTRFVNVRQIAVDFLSDFAVGDSVPTPTLAAQTGGPVPAFTYAVDPENPSTIILNFEALLPAGTYELTFLGAGFSQGFASSHGSSASFTFTAGTKVTPVVDAGDDTATAAEGGVWARTGSFADPDAGDAWTAEVDYGDGSGSTPLVLTGKTFDLGHRFTDDGTYTVSVTVRDSLGQSHTDTITVTVGNADPVPSIAGAAESSAEGKGITLTAEVSDPGAADTHTYAWTVTRNGVPYLLPGGTATDGKTFAFTPTDDGSYLVSLNVSDDDGGTGVATKAITVVNAGPVVDAGEDFTVDEGRAVLLSGSFIDSGGADTHTSAWSVVDEAGNTIASGPGLTLELVAPDDGTYTATFTVTDDDGTVGTDTRTMTVRNVAPTVSIIGAPDTRPEGAAISLGSTVAESSGADTYERAWTVTKDGQLFAQGADADFQFTPDDNGTYLVTLTVTDDDGGVGTDARSIDVTNAAPLPTIHGLPQAAAEGGRIDLTGSVSDAGSADTHSFAWTVTRNGTPYATGAAKQFSFVPDEDGTYVVTLVATDDDGLMAATTETISVSNAVPQLLDVAATAAVENGVVTLSGEIADGGVTDSYTLVVDWGDGSAPKTFRYAAGTTRFQETHQYLDNNVAGAMTIRLELVDDDGGEAVAQTTAAVTNAAPTLDPLSLSATAIDEGGSVTVTGKYADAGRLDTHSVIIDWGDGTSSIAVIDAATGTFTASHLYADDLSSPAGTPADVFAITATVTDDDGAKASASSEVTVRNVTPTVTITGPSAGFVVSVGEAVSFTGLFSDAGVGDTHLVRWTVDGSAFGVAPVTFEGTVDQVARGVAGSHVFTKAGVYRVTVTVLDDDGGVATANAIGAAESHVVVYDRAAGHVTGTGWINTRPGAYTADRSVSGRARFRAVARYADGSSVPSGQFQFRLGRLSFDAVDLDWLVVAGHKAQYSGTGRLNGADGYRFKATLIDGNGGSGGDKFRIQIWNPASGVAYDNQAGHRDDADPVTAIYGGNIVIHSTSPTRAILQGRREFESII